MDGSAHYDGRAIDAFVRPVNDAEQRPRLGDGALAWSPTPHRLDVRTVIFDDRIWTAGREGWRDYDPPDVVRATSKILEHRDHVHVDVFR